MAGNQELAVIGGRRCDNHPGLEFKSGDALFGGPASSQ
jgi:hypothetical protein